MRNAQTVMRTGRMFLLSVVRNQKGYLIVIVTLIGLILAIIFGSILPQLHMGQEIRAITNLNEYRAYEAARAGIEAVRAGLENAGDFQELIGTGSGIVEAIEDLCGEPDDPLHHEYRDEDGEIQFVSNCLGINVSDGDHPDEQSGLHIAVIISRNGVITENLNGNEKDDSLYLYNDGLPVDTPWLSADEVPPEVIWGDFRWVDADSNYYCDFDLSDSLPSTYQETADFKYSRYGDEWFLSVGNNGTWRRLSGSTELWNFQKDVSTNRPFQGKDNDGDGLKGPPHPDNDLDDRVEIFVIVRSTGITAAPGTNYETDKTDVILISEATNGALPNPMRQVLEAAFYLAQNGAHQFYFGQVHNVEE
jgi:hypothetical protein